jgi:hypothetical protein
LFVTRAAYGRHPEFPPLEFVDKSEVASLLGQYGYEEVADAEKRVSLVMPDAEGVVHLHLVDEGCTAEPRDGARVIPTSNDELPGVVEQVIHRLNLSDVLLIPKVKWRNVFDAVAFSLASNEAWQEFDAGATVELNTRDPLIVGPVDFPLLIDLIRALLNDAEGPDQGLIMTAAAVPVLAEVVPDGAVRLSLGNQALADQIMDVVTLES